MYKRQNIMKLSKSDYMLGDFCARALWLKKHKPKLLSQTENERCASGYDVQNLAQKLYPGGVVVPCQIWEFDKGAEITKTLSAKHDILFEAVAKLPFGPVCRIDILQKEGRKWNLIEIKATTSVQDEHIKDLAFQYFVFSNAGYKIKNCYVLYLNKDYNRKKKLNIKKLFTLKNVTDDVLGLYEETKEQILFLSEIQTQEKEPRAPIYKSCQQCDFYDYCCKKVPQYSIWDIFSASTADKIFKKIKSFDINDLNASDYDGKQFIDIDAWQKQKIHCEKDNIRGFLNTLKYPLYYLDYETIEPAIPLFENSRPYQQIPFQFSLHIQKTVGGKVTHFGFLHQDKSDPRRDLAEALVKKCGKRGSVIVYNDNFEKKRNEELAQLFPDLAKDILNINKRIVDLLVPFRSRALYHYKQHSSASIKKVLPAFTKLSYDKLDIKNGGEAMDGYFKFINGELTPKEEDILFSGLDKYCAQDTYAMVLLMDVLYKKAKS